MVVRKRGRCSQHGPARPAPQSWSEKRDDVVLQAIAWQRYYDALKADAASLASRLVEARRLQLHLAERAMAAAVVSMLEHT